MELIHADSNMLEIGQIDCYERFDACVALSNDNTDNDFELTLNEYIWESDPIECGHYIYIPDTEWGGVVERVTHSASGGTVRVSGACWRGLLDRFAVVPKSGETHVIVTGQEGNAMLSALLGSAPDYIVVSDEDSGIVCSGSIRYKSLLSAAETLLKEQNARLDTSFSDGTMTISAKAIVNHSDDIEFSQEYDSSLYSEQSSERYNHIIALGQGTMLDRQIVELWRLTDGTVTDDPTADGIPDPADLRTYIYDYSAVESLSALEDAARRKLSENAASKKLEISIGSSDTVLSLGDTAGVRDLLTGMSDTLTVSSCRLVMSENSVCVTHTLS